MHGVVLMINPGACHFSLTNDVVREALLKSSQAMIWIDGEMPYLGNKLKSEIFSKTLEVKLAKILTDKLGYLVTSPKNDNDPDLLFSNLPDGRNAVEIKCSSGETWRGGTFSKRSNPTLFVTRRGEKWNEFYAGYVFIKHDQWKPASDNYYAPTVPKKMLRDMQEREDIVGKITFGVTKSGRINKNQTKIHYEQLSKR